LNIIALKIEPFNFFPNGLLNLDQLLTHHTQYLKIDPIEFVKTAPSTRTGLTFEELLHGLEVDLF
jgi:hypothetical protein